MSTPRRHLLGSLAVVAALGVATTSCAQSSDPKTWEEAEQQIGSDGDWQVHANFMRQCVEANSDEAGFDEAVATAFCECTFGELREALAFEEFETLDSALRKSPDPNDLDGEALRAWRIAEPLLEGCVSSVS